eukprot:gene4437-21518_t
MRYWVSMLSFSKAASMPWYQVCARGWSADAHAVPLGPASVMIAPVPPKPILPSSGASAKPARSNGVGRSSSSDAATVAASCDDGPSAATAFVTK